MGGSIEGTSVVFKVFCSLKERRAICVCGVWCVVVCGDVMMMVR